MHRKRLPTRLPRRGTASPPCASPRAAPTCTPCRTPSRRPSTCAPRSCCCCCCCCCCRQPARPRPPENMIPLPPSASAGFALEDSGEPRRCRRCRGVPRSLAESSVVVLVVLVVLRLLRLLLLQTARGAAVFSASLRALRPRHWSRRSPRIRCRRRSRPLPALPHRRCRSLLGLPLPHAAVIAPHHQLVVAEAARPAPRRGRGGGASKTHVGAVN